MARAESVTFFPPDHRHDCLGMGGISDERRAAHHNRRVGFVDLTGLVTRNEPDGGAGREVLWDRAGGGERGGCIEEFVARRSMTMDLLPESTAQTQTVRTVDDSTCLYARRSSFSLPRDLLGRRSVMFVRSGRNDDFSDVRQNFAAINADDYRAGWPGCSHWKPNVRPSPKFAGQAALWEVRYRTACRTHSLHRQGSTEDELRVAAAMALKWFIADVTARLSQCLRAQSQTPFCLRGSLLHRPARMAIQCQPSLRECRGTNAIKTKAGPWGSCYSECSGSGYSFERSPKCWDSGTSFINT